MVSVPDARYGERICAFIVPTGEARPTVEAISEAFGEMGVAKYKGPERIEQIDELPLTTTGKVRHQQLCEVALRLGHALLSSDGTLSTCSEDVVCLVRKYLRNASV